MRPAAQSLALALALLSGCLSGSSTQKRVTVDPLGGPACPAEHLTIVARSLRYDVDPILLRFDGSLRSCRGLVLADVDEVPTAIGGMPDGSDLLGFDGRLARVRDVDVVWSVVADGRVLDAAHATIGGTAYVVVLWSSRGSDFADRLELRDPETGEVGKTYDVSSDVRGVTPSADGSDRVLLLDQYDGFSEVVVDPSAEALGGVGGLEVLAPRGIGSLGAIVSASGRVAVAARDGVLHWTPEAHGMLGPASCRWSRWVGDALPESCEYRGVAYDPSGGGDWLTICHAPEQGGALVRLDARDGCEPLLPASRLADHEAVDLAWTQ